MTGQKQKRSLTDQADEYIDIRTKLRTVDKRIKELKDESEQAAKIVELKDELKATEAKRNLEIGELNELIERRADYTGRARILMEVIAHGIKEENPTLLEGAPTPGIVHGGYKFSLADKLIIKRAKKT